MSRNLFLSVALAVMLGCNRNTSKPAPVPTPTNGPEPTLAPTTTLPPAARTSTPPAGRWESLLDAIDPARDVVAGTWTKRGSELHVAAGTGARLALPVAPGDEYDLRTSFMRHTGQHSIALFFPHGTGRAAFEADAWGEHLGGIQNIAGRTIRDNPTRRANVQLENGRRHTLTLEVRAGRVRGFLDDQQIVSFDGDGNNFALSDLWTLPGGKSLGLGAWESETTFHTFELRRMGSGSNTIAQAAPAVTAPPSAVRPTPPAPTPAPMPTPGWTSTGKRVLIVLANQDFFYREYGDPRAELEKAGVRVTVAAGVRGVCRPHANSGQGADGGIVQAELTLADVKADDYDAILFSGGWGSSMYQFAFQGRYANAAYNGNAAIKREANRLIGDFLKQDKYVCALCNAVSVLAWARIDGQSPLKGKRVCAPTRQAAAGIYNGQQAQPSCRWHPEQNGAQLVPAGSIGRPNTAEDDVVVDGKIVTGEDDISAREMGRRIVQLLAK